MKLQHVLGCGTDHRLYPESPLLVSSTDFIGIEVELEQMDIGSSMYDSIRPHNFWSTVHEDSIRQGGELIFAEPLCGANIIAALDEYEAFLERFKGKMGRLPVISDRCSLHTHLDVRDLEITTINTVAILYVLYEKVIFQFLNPSRYRNNYCIGLGSTNFSSILADMPIPTGDGYKYSSYVQESCDKYGAMNYLSTMGHGSLEFRGHPGSFNKGDIITWINMLLSLKTFARKFEPEGLPVAFIKGMDATSLTNEIFGEDAFKLIQTNFFQDNFNYGKSWMTETLLRGKLKDDTLKSLKDKRNPDVKLIDKYKEAN